MTDDGFETFWTAYPRKVGKGAARKSWAKAAKTHPAADIIAAATRFAAFRAGQNPKYTPHPATWLNAERWADEPEQLRAAAGDYQPWQNPTDQDLYDEEIY